jgi:predicted enzyme related to lactoylglutathione lyase
VRVLVTAVHVTDVHRAYAFYSQVLGLRDVVTVPEQDLYILGPSTGWEQGCQVILEPVSDPVTRAHCEREHREGNSALMMGVPDAELEYRRLKERGDIIFREELTQDVLGLHFQVDDTVGNILSIHTA